MRIFHRKPSVEEHQWTIVYRHHDNTFLSEPFVSYSPDLRIDGDMAQEIDGYGDETWWTPLVAEKVAILKQKMKQLPDGRWYV